MRITLIKTAEQHAAALARIESLMDAKAGTARGDELELLAMLVELYERDRFPIDLPDPVQAIRFRMEQAGLTQGDLVACIGSKSRVSEVLGGKRPLTLKMVRALHERMGIPLAALVGRQNDAVHRPKRLARAG